MMKKLLFCLLILAGAGTFQSCQQDDITTEAVANKSLTIRATLPGNAGTKVILGETTGATTKVYWEEGDKITLKIDEESTYTFNIDADYSNDEPSTIAQFTCTDSNFEGLAAGTYTFTYGNTPAKSQAGTKEGLSDYHLMEATVALSAEDDAIELNFKTKVAIVEITLPEGTTPKWVWLYDETSGECLAYKNKEASSNQFYFAVEPGTYKGIVYYQIGNDLYQFNIGTASNALSEGNLYRVNAKTVIDPIGTGASVSTSTGYSTISYTKLDNNTIYLYGGTALGKYDTNFYNGIANVIILEGVTEIKQYAFYGCTSLESIILPGSVTNAISQEAFYNCTSLSSITIHNGVTTISYGAFYGCTSLESITLPNSLTSIGDNAFLNCTSLKTITLPNSLTSIGSAAFNYCTSLETITLPEGVTEIKQYAFKQCTSLESITLPNSLTLIGDNAFYNCILLKTITLPNTVTTISDYAFSSCTSLETITLPEGVASIGSFAFRGCTSLKTITLPEGVTEIKQSAFRMCTSLKTITLPNSLTSIGSAAFDGCI